MTIDSIEHYASYHRIHDVRIKSLTQMYRLSLTRQDIDPPLYINNDLHFLEGRTSAAWTLQRKLS